MSGAEDQRRTEQGELIGVRTLRGFLKRVLADDAVADKVDELLFEHVVAGRYHPSVVAESLPGFLNDIIASAGNEGLAGDRRRADCRGARSGRGGSED